MFPFQFKRKQFPIRLSFAMTVNKAQGQTISNAGVYLPEPMFSHGQLYVALSRATARSNIRILTVPPSDKNDKKKKDKNKWYIYEKYCLQRGPHSMKRYNCYILTFVSFITDISRIHLNFR